MGKRILVISNNVFSTTYSNGKTIYSLIQALPQEDVAQLYFNSSPPEISGYKYYQLSDRNVLCGQFNASLRGKRIDRIKEQSDRNVFHPSSDIPRNNYTLALRELLWHNAWKSKQLDEWLNDFRPDIVFFLAGDCLFAYKICAYIVNKYYTKLSVYVTDDYVLPRSKESYLGKYRRKKISEMMMKCVKRSSAFFTISERMRQEYKKLYNKDSICIFNISESMRDERLCKKSEENETLILTYAGSLYYGRDEVLWKLAQAIERLNNGHQELKKARLVIYSNSKPSKEFLVKLKSLTSVSFLGGLDQAQLKQKLNLSNILVFVESFDSEQIEKTRLSLSTKIPEYIPLGKPIVAIGPRNIGSMDYLEDVSVCIYNESDIYNRLERLFVSVDLQREYACKALEKYKQNSEMFCQYRNILLWDNFTRS